MSNGKKTVSFWLDKEDDRDIIAWLATQRNQSRAIRDALRAAIAPPTGLDLGAIRGVVEAALDEKLANLTLVNGNGPETNPADPSAEDPELAAALDCMF